MRKIGTEVGVAPRKLRLTRPSIGSSGGGEPGWRCLGTQQGAGLGRRGTAHTGVGKYPPGPRRREDLSVGVHLVGRKRHSRMGNSSVLSPPENAREDHDREVGKGKDEDHEDF